MSPVFIVGVGRSGTSLLQSMLASHSALSFLPETAFIRQYIVNNRLKNCINDYGVTEANNTLKNDKVLSRIDFQIPEVVASETQRVDLEYYISLQQKGMIENNKPRFGDKDPRLIEYLITLFNCFPQAYVINIIRDPRDILVSKKKAAWSAGRSTLFYAFANRVQLKLGHTLGKSLFGKRYIEVIYEDLIKDPEFQLKELCIKLDLNYEKKLLEFGTQAKKLVDESEKSWKKETFGPLLSDNANKWKEALSLKEIALTELSCVDAFKIGNYKKSEALSKLDTLSKLKVYLTHFVILTLTPVYITYRKLEQKRRS